MSLDFQETLDSLEHGLSLLEKGKVSKGLALCESSARVLLQRVEGMREEDVFRAADLITEFCRHSINVAFYRLAYLLFSKTMELEKDPQKARFREILSLIYRGKIYPYERSKCYKRIIAVLQELLKKDRDSEYLLYLTKRYTVSGILLETLSQQTGVQEQLKRAVQNIPKRWDFLVENILFSLCETVFCLCEKPEASDVVAEKRQEIEEMLERILIRTETFSELKSILNRFYEVAELMIRRGKCDQSDRIVELLQLICLYDERCTHF